jgi:hypothetical protein
VDRYRPQLTSYLEGKTGKKVEIAGLALTFFPVTMHIDLVSRSDMNDAILKLQESEKRTEQERLQEEERQAQIRTQIGHNDEVSTPLTASRAVN